MEKRRALHTWENYFNIPCALIMSKLRKFRVIFTRFNCDIENKTKQIINNNNNFHRKQLKTFGILLFTFNSIVIHTHRELKKFGNCCNYVTLWVAVCSCVFDVLLLQRQIKMPLCFAWVLYKLTIKVHDINFICYWKNIASRRNWKTFTC